MDSSASNNDKNSDSTTVRDGAEIGEDGIPLDTDFQIGEGDLDLYEDIDLNAVKDPAWLIRVPEFLLEKWCDTEIITAADMNLGRITYKRDMSGNPTQIKVHLPEDAEWSKTIPKQYNMTMRNDKPDNVYVFTEDHTTYTARRIIGTVVREGAINPVFNDEYRQLILNRAKKIEDNRPQIKVFEERKEMGHHFTQVFDTKAEKGLGRFGKQIQTQQLQQEKRERISKEDLINILFSIFEYQPHWKFKDILTKTQQPQAWLKEVLNEICILNKRGPFLGNYELKPEFKRQDIDSNVKKEEGNEDQDDMNDEIED